MRRPCRLRFVPRAEALPPRVAASALVAVSDPLPDPEPSPGPDPGTDTPVAPPPLPPSGPVGPGTT